MVLLRLVSAHLALSLRDLAVTPERRYKAMSEQNAEQSTELETASDPGAIIPDVECRPGRLVSSDARNRPLERKGSKLSEPKTHLGDVMIVFIEQFFAFGQPLGERQRFYILVLILLLKVAVGIFLYLLIRNLTVHLGVR